MAISGREFSGSEMVTQKQRMNRSVSAKADRAFPPKVFCAICMSKTISPLIGISFAMMGTGTIISTEINDSLTLTRTINKIQIHQPCEIVVESSCPQRLISILESNTNCKISIVNKHYFNVDIPYLKTFSVERDPLLGELEKRYFASSSAIAVMKYAASCLHRVSKFRFKYEACESTMFIDSRTSQNLELVDNLIDKTSRGLSLFKFLNSTKTKMGERVLRNNVLQPLTDLESLNMRLESVQELMRDPVLLKEMRDLLNNLQDLDRLFNMILMTSSSSNNSNTEQNINNVILLKQTIEITSQLATLLRNSDSLLLKEVQQLCENEAIKEVHGVIEEYMNEDCTWASAALALKNQKCYAVKSGMNGFLDVSRQVYHNIINEIMKTIESLAQEYELQLDQLYNSQRGFIIKIKNFEGVIDELPEVFINKTKKRGNIIECTTLDLMKLNSRMRSVLNEIILMSDHIIEMILDKVETTISVFFMLSEAIAILDLLCCFAHNAVNSSMYTCPELNHGDKIVMKSSRHPILDSTQLIPNDIYSIHDTSRIQIITGPNMSGKSVYLRQTALLTVMCQIGSLFPAEYAMCPIFHNLNARISSDNYEINCSTFSAEMSEMAQILHETRHHENSLVIIDELGRGSSFNDGFAISLAITEALISMPRCMVLLSTHFHDIPKILANKPGVVHLKMQAELQGEKLVQHHKLKTNKENNGQEVEGYGIVMAQNFLPEGVIRDAKHVSKMLSLKKTGRESNRADEMVYSKRKLMLSLIQNLKLLQERDQVNVTRLKILQDAFITDFQNLSND